MTKVNNVVFVIKTNAIVKHIFPSWKKPNSNRLSGINQVYLTLFSWYEISVPSESDSCDTKTSAWRARDFEHQDHFHEWLKSQIMKTMLNKLYNTYSMKIVHILAINIKIATLFTIFFLHKIVCMDALRHTFKRSRK